jgi:hypothetical protein
LSIDDPPNVVVSLDRLMEASSEYLVDAQHSNLATEQTVANRILESAKDFRRWEDAHATLMRPISGERGSAAQRAALLSGALSLVHRKALFEYMRDRQIRGDERHRLVAHFFSDMDYARAVVNEHGNYLRSAASYLCSSRVGAEVMFDSVFQAPLIEYEALYEAYFTTYCDSALTNAQRPAHTAPLLRLMKQQVCDWRAALLALAHSRSGIWRRPLFAPKYNSSKQSMRVSATAARCRTFTLKSADE